MNKTTTTTKTEDCIEQKKRATILIAEKEKKKKTKKQKGKTMENPREIISANGWNGKSRTENHVKWLNVSLHAHVNSFVQKVDMSDENLKHFQCWFVKFFSLKPIYIVRLSNFTLINWKFFENKKKHTQNVWAMWHENSSTTISMWKD